MKVDEPVIPDAVSNALSSATRLLLEARTAGGHWEGQLSSSALSTATAVFALSLYVRHPAITTAGLSQDRHHQLIRAGIAWLIQNQNSDGGWGDTVLSISNISTTALCWVALSTAGEEAGTSVAAAERWLVAAAGSLDSADLARAITARYGKDRTFSVPILMMCALAGRLGTARSAWRHVAQLPFEVAAFPQAWFRFLRLPVVSYALPALIAIGLVRHRQRPSWNLLASTIRRLTTTRALRVLARIQPAGGGFLEAAPLTSFVSMSLIAAGLADHLVVASAIGFLVNSARSDGSWPIDTNLATWVTTLSVNALAAGGGAARVAQVLPSEDRSFIREWLLAQQYRRRHPYTGTPPGGWAWTNLPGGVPDADDTAGALLALHYLGDIDSRVTDAAVSGVRWLLDLQNSDGGIPTFCRGWTKLPFDRSGPDLTAHALLAWRAWQARLPAALGARVASAACRALQYLAATQRMDGSWLPLWFGNQFAANEENATYGTAKVLAALLGQSDPIAVNLCNRGVQYLLAAENDDGGWGGERGTPSSVEETALAIDALTIAAGIPQTDQKSARTASVTAARNRGRDWLIRKTDGGRRFEPAPIGLYFARLWYFESAYPLLLAVWAIGRCAAPAMDRDCSASHRDLAPLG